MKVEIDTPSNSYWIIKAYPFGVLVLALVLNFMFGIEPIQISNPSREILGLLSCSARVIVKSGVWVN